MAHTGVFIVEGDDDTRTSLRLLLEREGYRVVTVATAAAEIVMLEQPARPPQHAVPRVATGHPEPDTPLRHPPEQFLALFRGALDAVLVCDNDRRYLEANVAACELFGVPLEHLIGRRIDDFVPASAAKGIDEAWRLFMDVGHQEGEFPLRRANGDERIADFRARAHFLPGRHFSILRDVTDRKRAEQERDSLLQTLEQFMAILSHDLRSPLSAITFGSSALLKRGALSDLQHRTMALISSSAGRAARMVTQLLDVARSRSGAGLPLVAQPVVLEHLVREVIDEVAGAHPASLIELNVSGDTSGEWDSDRISQVIANLLGNALEHGRPGSPVDVGLCGGDTAVVVTVHNEGDPIPSHLLATLFEPFRRGRADSLSKGLGLGLFICKEIVVAHGGTLDVRSSREEGTIFAMDLPRRRLRLVG